MQKRIVIAAFVIVVAVLSLLVLARYYKAKPEKKESGSSVAAPVIETESESVQSSMQSYADDEVISSLIPLNGDETLITVISQDFDGDGFEDQVNAIKTISSPYISVIVGLYNPELQQYERSAVVATTITQVRSFNIDCIDLTGSHKNAVVYQGYKENGNSVLQAFFISRVKGQAQIQMIASFEGDDSVFIQQVERLDSYERSNGDGTSYPIWVYTSDPESTGTNDQLQIMYNWDERAGKYVEVNRLKITGSNLAAAELARIQDGTEETFCEFLNGVWYLTSTKSASRYYIYFNYPDKEIIFMNDDTEEVYSWEGSHLRRNGVYFQATNQDINNLKRRIDVSLRSVDKVYIRLQDDVRMLITESTSWDGEYKKMSQSALVESTMEKLNPCREYFTVLQDASSWKASDGSTISFVGGNYSSIGSDGLVDTGIYTQVVFKNQPFIQIRSDGASPWLTGMYRLSYGTDEKTGKKVKTSVILQPYVLTPESAIPSENRSIILTKNSDE